MDCMAVYFSLTSLLDQVHLFIITFFFEHLLEQIMSWLLDLRHCNSTVAGADDVASAALCSLSLPQMYTLMVLTARHANVEKAIYRVRLFFFSSGGAGGRKEKKF